jgi:hypothetical protein
VHRHAKSCKSRKSIETVTNEDHYEVLGVTRRASAGVEEGTASVFMAFKPSRTYDCC